MMKNGNINIQLYVDNTVPNLCQGQGVYVAVKYTKPLSLPMTVLL